jgi:hypothetical protein
MHTKFPENLHRLSLFVKCIQMSMTSDDVITGNGIIWGMMCVHRGSWVMASSSSNLAAINVHYIGITDCRKLRSIAVDWFPVV